jgi:PEP-CTERM motif
MKRLLGITAIVLGLMSGSLFADTIISLVPNDGSGDNFGFFQRGGGVTEGAFGGTEWPFFNAFDGYAPGSTFGNTSVTIFFDDAFARFGGHSYELGGGPGNLFISSFTFPTNGKDFTARVALEFSSFFTLPDGEPFNMEGGAAGTITFHFIGGSYFPDERGFVEKIVPEPGTWELMGTGLIGVFALARKSWPSWYSSHLGA